MTLALRTYLREEGEKVFKRKKISTEGFRCAESEQRQTTQEQEKQADTFLSLGKPKVWSQSFTVVAFFSQHFLLPLLWFRVWSSIAFKFFGKVSKHEYNTEVIFNVIHMQKKLKHLGYCI